MIHIKPQAPKARGYCCCCLIRIQVGNKEQSLSPEPRLNGECWDSVTTSFIIGKNEEIWVKMLSYIAEPNARTFTQCYIKHLEILLSLLFCVNLIWLYSYEWVNIPLKATPLHRGGGLTWCILKLDRFGAQWNIQWNWHAEWPWTKNCLLELNIQMIWIMLHIESYN